MRLQIRRLHAPLDCLRPRLAGAGIAETTAAQVILIPLIVMALYAIVEVSTYFAIRNHVSMCAHLAARNLVIAYWKDPSIASDRSMQDSQVFNQIRSSGYLNDSAQFDDAVWELNNAPKTVSVSVHYKGGEFNLPRFPHPDPLHLGPINLTVSATNAID